MQTRNDYILPICPTMELLANGNIILSLSMVAYYNTCACIEKSKSKRYIHVSLILSTRVSYWVGDALNGLSSNYWGDNPLPTMLSFHSYITSHNHKPRTRVCASHHGFPLSIPSNPSQENE